MVTKRTGEQQLNRMIKDQGISFGPVIVAEAKRAGVRLALALALVEQESGFKNIFGCDGGRPRNTAPWCHQDVTRERVQELIRFVDHGGTSNGVGLTQLTSIDLIKQAEAEGGAHTVDAQCRVGFRFLHDLIERNRERTGIGAYNGGEGNPNMQYADAVLKLRAKWQSRIDTLGADGVSPPGDAEVHRDLTLTTPYTEGPDVFALQRAINNRARELPYTDADLKQDSQLGPHTLSACGRVAVALGLSEPACSVIKAGTVVQLTQRLIRDPSKRNAAELQRAAGREPELKRRHEARGSGAGAAVKWARSKIGVHENPPSSNWGKPVQEWITFTGYDGPVPWCGCFAAFAVVKMGGAKVPERMRLGFHEYIIEDARAGRNGFERAVTVDRARPGDIAVFSFGHIGLVVGRTKDGLIHTIDGNTSATDASSNNGGEVAEHRRSTSLVSCVGRLHY